MVKHLKQHALRFPMETTKNVIIKIAARSTLAPTTTSSLRLSHLPTPNKFLINWGQVLCFVSHSLKERENDQNASLKGQFFQSL